MKKCDQIKEFILTDYIDGQMDKNLIGDLENHLLDCSDCRAFFKEVKLKVALPFQGDLQQPVPAALWDTIRENIESQNQKTNPLVEFLDGLKGWMALPRMVPVLASFMVMFLAGSVTLNTIQIQRAQEKDQGEYLVSTLSSNVPSALAENDGGTAIEHYFL